MQACTAPLHASRRLPPGGRMFPRYLLEMESYLRHSLGRGVVSRTTLSAPPSGHWVWGQERRWHYLPRSHFGNIRTETVFGLYRMAMYFWSCLRRRYPETRFWPIVLSFAMWTSQTISLFFCYQNKVRKLGGKPDKHFGLFLQLWGDGISSE